MRHLKSYVPYIYIDHSICQGTTDIINISQPLVEINSSLVSDTFSMYLACWLKDNYTLYCGEFTSKTNSEEWSTTNIVLLCILCFLLICIIYLIYREWRKQRTI